MTTIHANCPSCSRPLAPMPKMVSATLVVQRKCRNCHERWQLIVKPIRKTADGKGFIHVVDLMNRTTLEQLTTRNKADMRRPVTGPKGTFTVVTNTHHNEGRSTAGRSYSVCDKAGKIVFTDYRLDQALKGARQMAGVDPVPSEQLD